MAVAKGAYMQGRYERIVEKSVHNDQCYSFCHARLTDKWTDNNISDGQKDRMYTSLLISINKHGHSRRGG